MNFSPIVLISAALGMGVYLSNPRLLKNQVFLFSSILVTIWLILVSKGTLSLASPEYSQGTVSFFWHRANAAVAALFPWTFWLLREATTTPTENRCRVILKSLPWFFIFLILSVLCYTKSFIHEDFETHLPKRGSAYLIYAIVGSASHTILLFQSWEKMLRSRGIERFEILFLGVMLSGAWLYGALATSLGNLFYLRLIKFSPIYLLVATWTLAAWSATTYRVFLPKQLLLFIFQKTTITIILCFGLFIVWRFYQKKYWPLEILAGIAIIVSISIFLDKKLSSLLDIHERNRLKTIKDSVTKLAIGEPNPEKLVLSFSQLLTENWNVERAVLLFENGKDFSGSSLRLSKDRQAYAALIELDWVSQVRLERSRKIDPSGDISSFLVSNDISLIAASSDRHETPTLIVALGKRNHHWPFTYPEVSRLRDITELMDNILTRSRLTAQAALEARVEHLAMMSRGLAHDLKNLITPVSSFLIHTDNHFPPDSAEGEVHSAARRSVRIMTDYVREALFFSERLSPTFALIDFSKLFQTVHDFVDSRADRRGVEVLMKAAANLQLTADTVLMQRVLGNLVNNAIDASRAGQSVKISVSDLNPEIVRFEVKDAGCGIATECLSRIFDPYFTTKEFGHDVRGFGLGLTICQKIVQLHSGAISVESQLGQGTRVFVDLPRNPPEGGTAKRAP